MQNKKMILEITELTMRLKNARPEVYDQLDENPITLKITQVDGASDAELREYQETLKELLAKHEN
jgi:hypothetical protein